MYYIYYQEYIILERVSNCTIVLVISPRRCFLHIFEYLHIQPLAPPRASTVPFRIDDPAQKKNLGNDLNDVIADVYNRNQSATLCRGVKHPKLIPIITTNYALHQEER